MKFNKAHINSCPWDGQNPCSTAGWKGLLERGFAEVVRVLVNYKMSMGQQCTLAVMKVNCILR